MTFTEEWFGEASQEALADLARKTAGIEGRIIEIGSWEGRSTVALANAMHPAVVHAVDTWEGSAGEISATLAAERDVYACWESNIALLTKGNVEPFACDWRAYFSKVGGPIRFAFIDAEHSYEEVSAQIAAIRPLLVPGGVICGDDQHHPPVRQAVLEAFPRAQAIATLWFWINEPR